MAEVKMQKSQMPGMPVPQNVVVYIDGFNLYFGIRSSGLGRYLWLDLCSFAKSLLRDGQRLSAVKYFTSRVASPESKRKRQAAYLDALNALDPSLLSIAYHCCPRQAKLNRPALKAGELRGCRQGFEVEVSLCELASPVQEHCRPG